MREGERGREREYCHSGTLQNMAYTIILAELLVKAVSCYIKFFT